MNLAPRLLWIDCTAGASVGVAVMLLHSWLAGWYGLPSDFVWFLGLANFGYGIYSFTLAIRQQRPRLQFAVLVAANLVWAMLCLRWAMQHFGAASLLGLAHLLLEAVFVGGLGLLEWRHRHSLRVT